MAGARFFSGRFLRAYRRKQTYDEARIHDTLYKKDNAEPVLEGDGAVIPQEAKESVSDEIFETTAANTDNTDIINTDTENPDNDRDS